MERFASTLATTAACVGLMVASHLMIVHDRASVPDAPVKVQPAALAAPATETRAWAEPPAKPVSAKPVSAKPVSAKPLLALTETTWTAAPAAAGEPAPVAEPAAPASVAPAPQTAPKADLKADKAKRAAEQAKRRKLAQARARRTQTALRDLPVDQASAPAPAPQAEPASTRRVDPIGDLLRGLGIGRQG